MKKVTRRALRGHFHSPVVPAGHGNLRRIRDPGARRHEVRILRLRSQARFAQDDTALRNRVRTFRNPTTKLRTALGPGRPFMSRGCGLATDQKAVRRRGPGRVVLGSKPQLATTEKLVSWAVPRASAKTLSANR